MADRRPTAVTGRFKVPGLRRMIPGFTGLRAVDVEFHWWSGIECETYFIPGTNYQIGRWHSNGRGCTC